MAQTEWEHIFLTEAEILEERDSWSLEFDDSLVPNSPEPGWKQYIRKTSAWFSCSSCPRSWPSNRVRVVFHMYLKNGQGMVKVRRLRQDCKKCLDPSMEEPNISAENIEILMEHLVKKIRVKCYREHLGDAERGFLKEEVRRPHEPDHCEACYYGVCDEMSGLTAESDFEK